MLIELKSSTDESVSITEAYHQLQTYKTEIPSLLAYNSFLVTSDGFNARVGSITANEDRFMPWRTVDGETVAPISQPQLEVLIKGMFDKSRFLDIIRNFILFQTDGKEIIKILAGYHQYHALKKAVECTERAAMEGATGGSVLSGTPRVTDYIDIYDMTRAVEDGTTVKIYYESRIARLELSDADKLKIDEEFEEITEFQEEHEKQRQKSKWSRLEALAGAEKRVQLIARDIVEHYEKRQEAAFGKAMVVVMSRRIAVDLYNAIIDLCPDWHSDDDNTGVIKVVMTGSASDLKEWQQHIGSKSRRKLLAKRMRDEDDALKIVIVRDMWLTGFDVPSLYTMYIDKPMSGHNLMQAIARVNRVFRDKPGGLVVDYIGIADSLKNALSQYTVSDRQNTGVDTSLAVDVLLENYELIQDLLYGFDYSSFKSGSASERMQTIVATINYILGLGEEARKDFINHVTALSKAYTLCSTTDEGEKLNVEIGFFKAVKSGMIKMIPAGTQRRTRAQIDYQLNQLISKSVISEEVVDVFGAVGLDKPNIAILSDEFLEEVKGLQHKNLAVELLKRLLAGEVKAVARRNLIQSRKFSEMLESAVIKYQNRTIQTTQVILE